MAIKELIVVFVIAGFVFTVARPACVRFITPETFDRRRNVWLFLTAVAFIVPSFWLYVAFAAPLLAWLGRKDDNPQALLLFLYFLVPPNQFKVPMIGAEVLFELNQSRLIVLVIIVPWFLSRINGARVSRALGWNLADSLLCAYVLLQVILLAPYESFTITMRRGFVLTLDSVAIFYFMSRISPVRAKLVDALLMLCLLGAIFALLAVFENLKSWSLYSNMYARWGALGDLWQLRDGRLRALVSTGHALTLGSVLAMAFCFWLWFRGKIDGRWRWMAGAAALLAGLLAANARGPWLTAALAFVMVTFMTVTSFNLALRRAAALVAVAAAVLLSPIGDSVVAKLPFIGEDEWGNVAYRVRLAEMSWRLVWLNPFFGDPFVMRQLEELRQAQGIIDLVNAYATVAMFHGLVGLALYVGVFLYALFHCWKRMRSWRRVDPDMQRLGIVLFAALVSTLFFMATAGFAKYEYALAGLLISYAMASPAQVGKRATQWALDPA